MSSHPNELHVILGTGQMGMAVMRELCARGRRVRMVNRSGKANVLPDVEVTQADVTDPGAARLAGQGASVIYNCLNAPYTDWPQKLPAMMRGAIECAVASGAKLVCADNLYMYGKVSGALTENLPYAATTRKGRVRAEIAAMPLEAHASGQVRATIGRASDFYGPGVLDSTAGERIFAHALAGKPADVLGDPDMPHTYTFIDDFATGLVTLGERDEALGRVWHIPSAPTLTTRQFVELVYKEIGAAPKLRVASRWLISALGLFTPIMRELKEMLYEFEEPFVVDHSRFEQAFGAHVTPHAEAIRQTVAWYRRHMNLPATASSARAISS
jgi:nucleoside-diphosphate-sugar epimerase